MIMIRKDITMRVDKRYIYFIDLLSDIYENRDLLNFEKEIALLEHVSGIDIDALFVIIKDTIFPGTPAYKITNSDYLHVKKLLNDWGIEVDSKFTQKLQDLYYIEEITMKHKGDNDEA